MSVINNYTAAVHPKLRGLEEREEEEENFSQ